MAATVGPHPTSFPLPSGHAGTQQTKTGGLSEGYTTAGGPTTGYSTGGQTTGYRPTTTASPTGTLAPPTKFHPGALKRLGLPWQLVVGYFSFLAWFFTIPYRLFKGLSPDFIQPYIRQGEDLFMRYAHPAIQWMYSSAYAVVSYFDYLIDFTIVQSYNFNENNLKHFVTALQGYLRAIDVKVGQIERHGLSGITMHA